jgi:CheY-like chemotaxis protein
MSSNSALKKRIKRVSVVDDDPAARTGLEFAIKDAGLEAVQESGPLRTLEEFTVAATQHADAAVCDHHLRKKNYANFNGSEAVAHWYHRQFPAVLCTSLEGDLIDEIRPHRRFIPVVIKPSDADPDTVTHGFEVCLAEFDNKFLASRKPWRTLVRLDSLEIDGQRQVAYFIIPGWNSSERIRLQLAHIPIQVRHKFKSQTRFHAAVNLGAETRDELYFSDWETS